MIQANMNYERACLLRRDQLEVVVDHPDGNM
jgi:hypothetical protein